MSEAIDYPGDSETGGQGVQPDLRGLLLHMRAARSQPDGASQEDGEDGAPALDGLPEEVTRRVVGRQRIMKISLPGGVVLIDRTKEIFLVVGPDDERLRELEDEETGGEADEPTDYAEEVPEATVRPARSRYSRRYEEDDSPLGLGKTFRILGARALRATRDGVVGMAEDYGDRAERRYGARQREEAARKRHDKEPYRVRAIRTQLDAYFKLIASGGLNTRGQLPDAVVHRLKQMDDLGYPYYDDYLYDDQGEP